MSGTVYLEAPGGDLLVVHGPDMGQVKRLVEKRGYEKITATEFSEKTDGRDDSAPEGRRWTFSGD